MFTGVNCRKQGIALKTPCRGDLSSPAMANLPTAFNSEGLSISIPHEKFSKDRTLSLPKIRSY